MKIVRAPLFFLTLSCFLAVSTLGKVIKMKSSRPSSKYQNVNSMGAELASKQHPSRYLKEENFSLENNAKQKLFGVKLPHFHASRTNNKIY